MKILWSALLHRATITTATVLRRMHRSTCVSWYTNYRPQHFAEENFYCPNDLADGNQNIQIRKEDTRVLYNGITYTVSI